MKSPNHVTGSKGLAGAATLKQVKGTFVNREELEAGYINHARLEVTSPFRNAAMLPPAPKLQPSIAMAGISIVGKGERAHYVRTECQHWAPNAQATGDCRFSCGSRA